MSKDPPTDPGLNQKSLPDSAEPQTNEHIGTHGELILPDVVPIVRSDNPSRLARWVGQQWIEVNYFARGWAGTGVEWYLFFVGVGEQNKKLSIVLIGFLLVTVEEKYSDQPFFTNMVKYVMHAVDPDAAEIIFKEREVDPDPIGKAAAIAVEDATKSYMESAEYRTLKDDIEADVRYQSRRQAYLSAGMKEDVLLLDEEMAVIREERSGRKKLKEEAEKKPDQSVESHKQGSGITPREEAPLEEEIPPPPTEEEIPQEGEGSGESPSKEGSHKGERSKAERRKPSLEPPPLPDEVRKLLDPR